MNDSARQPDTSPDDSRPPRPAATLLLVRSRPDHSTGIEVLLLKRSDVKDQNSGAWVFPGGVVDKADSKAESDSPGQADEFDDAAASARLGLSSGGLAYYVAAIRECFEETGLLLAVPRGIVSTFAPLAAQRAALRGGTTTFNQVCDRAGLQLAAADLAYFSHWITPKGLPKRFDTRFFLAVAPSDQSAEHDGTEAVAHLWIDPNAALAHDSGLKLMNATRKVLANIARFRDVATLMAWAHAPGPIAVIVPRFATFRDGRKAVLPDDSAWSEVCLVDPEDTGKAYGDLQPGRVVRLMDALIRVTANNGSAMTGAGTNSYLVGGGPRNEWAVIDPGPADADHIKVLQAAAPGSIRWIFATHSHLDHSPGIALLKAATGAQVYGRLADHSEWQDPTFSPDHRLAGGERIVLTDNIALRVIHTPGHASNHLCYLLEEQSVLITGDHLIQGSTVVINTPDGNMTCYLQSLSALLQEQLLWLAPGHGFLMAEPATVIRKTIQHRMNREAKVIAALRQSPNVTVDELLPQVYSDVPVAVHGMARRSLQAHLLKLLDERVALEKQGLWSLGGHA